MELLYAVERGVHVAHELDKAIFFEDKISAPRNPSLGGAEMRWLQKRFSLALKIGDHLCATCGNKTCHRYEAVLVFPLLEISRAVLKFVDQKIEQLLPASVEFEEHLGRGFVKLQLRLIKWHRSKEEREIFQLRDKQIDIPIFGSQPRLYYLSSDKQSHFL